MRIVIKIESEVLGDVTVTRNFEEYPEDLPADAREVLEKGLAAALKQSKSAYGIQPAY